MSVPDPIDPAQQRISDADRHQVAEALREAAGDGRIDLGELDERLTATYGAKTYAELVPVLADLPVEVPRPPGAPRLTRRTSDLSGAPRHDGTLAIMSSHDRRGVWEVGERHSAFALMGSVVLDLREAVFPESGEVEITANAVMGSVDVYVNAQTVVHLSGMPIMGEFSRRRDRVPADPGPGSPIVRIRGFALMGGVSVRRRPMPGDESGIRRFFDR